MKFAQLISGSAGKVGIQGQYLDGKGNFVDDTLPRPVAAAEQFQIFDSIVEPLPVDMVHGFVGQKLSSNVGLHDVTMFENFMHWYAVLRWYAQYCVLSFNAPRYFWKSMTLAMQFAGPFIFALLAAQGVLLIDGARPFSAASVELFAAVFAISFVALVGSLAAANRRARYGTVRRVFAEFLSVSCQVCGFVREIISAFAAVKVHGGYLRGRTTVQSFMCLLAIKPAKTLAFEFCRNFKRLVALLTSVDHAHLPSPFALKVALG